VLFWLEQTATERRLVLAKRIGAVRGSVRVAKVRSQLCLVM
jgi:hypothetical protein